MPIKPKKLQKFQKTFAAAILAAVLLLPVFAWAADPTLGTIITKLRDLVNQLVSFIIGLAVLVFLWGIFKYITAGSDNKKVEEARNFIIFGIIGIFVMFSVWGLVNLLVNTFGFTDTNKVKPTVPAF